MKQILKVHASVIRTKPKCSSGELTVTASLHRSNAARHPQRMGKVGQRQVLSALSPKVLQNSPSSTAHRSSHNKLFFLG